MESDGATSEAAREVARAADACGKQASVDSLDNDKLDDDFLAWLESAGREESDFAATYFEMAE